MQIRLLELSSEDDSLAACAAAGRAVLDPNLRGWAALVPLEPPVLAEGLKQAGLAVLRGARGALVLGNLSQLWSAGRSLADGLERPVPRALAAELMTRAAAVEGAAQPGEPRWFLPRGPLGPLEPGRGRTLIMGIINVTPDSFAGGFPDPQAAIAEGLRLAAEGADLLDVGGESTRPGALPVPAAEERARTEPVVRALVQAGHRVSIDTTKAEVAQAALDAGAEIVNDVSALLRDPALGPLVARTGAALCLMHLRGTPADMQSRANYQDLLGEVQSELAQALARAHQAGIAGDRIALDPGLGFAKTGAHNLLLLRRLRELTQLGHPLLVGASRKSFLGKLTGKPPAERAIASAAAAALAAANGAAILRVHDVAATREALLVADAVRSSTR